MLISSSSCNLARSTGISFRVLGVHAGGAGPNNLTRICTFLAFSPPFSTNFFFNKNPKNSPKTPCFARFKSKLGRKSSKRPESGCVGTPAFWRSVTQHPKPAASGTTPRTEFTQRHSSSRAHCRGCAAAPRAPIALKPGSLDAPENCAYCAAALARGSALRERDRASGGRYGSWHCGNTLVCGRV